jgi:hypothetical protein
LAVRAASSLARRSTPSNPESDPAITILIVFVPDHENDAVLE